MYNLTKKPAARSAAQDGSENKLQPPTTTLQRSPNLQPADGEARPPLYSVARAALGLITLLLMVALGLGLLTPQPANAQTNRLGPKGWKVFPTDVGPTDGQGLPREVTVGTNTWLEIGTNAANGAKGVAGAGAASPEFKCPGSGFCNVSFQVNWSPSGGESAFVLMVPRGKKGREAKFTLADGVQTISQGCGTNYHLEFGIENLDDEGHRAAKQSPKSSRLRILPSSVIYYCSTNNNSTLAQVQVAYYFGQPRSPASPLPLDPATNGMLATLIPSGVSPLANPFSSGSNYLDAVLPAEDDTILYKYDPLSDWFETYYRSGGEWFPSDGTLAPGEAAFIDSRGPQQFTFTGQYVPFPFAPHPSSGSAFFANPMPWPVLVEDVTGFKPVVGDVVLMFRHGDTNGSVPSTGDSVFIFRPDNFADQPEIPAGETVRVFFGDPREVPLTISRTDNNVVVSAPGGLPSEGILQTATAFGSGWKSLLGVADYYSEPASDGLHLFRLGFNLPTGYLFGRVTGPNGVPVSGTTVQLGPNGQSQTILQGGSFTFADAPQGMVDLLVTAPVRVVDATVSQVTEYQVSLPLTVDLSYGTASVNLKQDILAQVLRPPAPCNCVPWCGIVGGTVNGVQKVVAGGGKLPPSCNGQATVTIQGPGGINVNLGQGGRRTFSPAASGVWSVTSTVCGITRTCTITLP